MGKKVEDMNYSDLASTNFSTCTIECSTLSESIKIVKPLFLHTPSYNHL